MIRIEDEEDVEAFKEARAEIDDEFDEIEGRSLQTPTAKDQTAGGTKALEAEEAGESMRVEEGVVEEEPAEKSQAEEIQFEFEMLGQPKPGEEKTPEQIAKE